MNFVNLHLLSTYLKKWSYHDHKITINYSFCFDFGYERSHVDMRIGSPMHMLNEIMSHLFQKAKEHMRNQAEDNGGTTNGPNSNIILVNEPEVKRKLSIFLSKILKEFNNNKRSRGRSRMISTRSLDFYYNDFEFEPLEDEIKFYVHLNRGINKMNGDLWSNAVDDFKYALAIDENNPTANAHMATALGKLGRHGEAVKHLKIQAEHENTPESLNALASACIFSGQYKEAEKIFKTIEKKFPDALIALYGRAHLAYKQGKGFKQILDRIYNKDEHWLRDKLKNDWDFKLPGYGEDEDHMWNAAIAARYLGFERPFDLTKLAFNEEVPSYFDSERGTIRFVKAELDHWVEVMNRYKVLPESYEVHEDRLTKEEIKKGAKKRRRRTTKKNVEEASEVA